MHNQNQLFIGIWILLVCVGITPVQAAPRLDASFGLDGRVAVELGLANSAHAVVVQPDGKIVVAGSSSKGATLNFSLLRFNKDGSLDPTFNGDGSVTVITAGIAILRWSAISRTAREILLSEAMARSLLRSATAMKKLRR